MKHLNFILLACFLFTSGVSYAQDDDSGKGSYLEARIQPTNKELRKQQKKIMVAREVDSLIVSQDFKFEPVNMQTSIQPIYSFARLINAAKTGFAYKDSKEKEEEKAKRKAKNEAGYKDVAKHNVIISSRDYIRIHDGWFETKLFHEWLPLDDHRVYGFSHRPDTVQENRMEEVPLMLPPAAFNFKFTESTKEEDNIWFMTIEVDRIGQKCKYEFVVQPTGWTVLRCTSNRWGKSVIYTGWLVRT